MKVCFAPHRLSVKVATAAALAVLPALAAAQDAPVRNGVSADPEMVNPRFGDSALPGVNAPSQDVKNTIRWGLFLQYQTNPVTGYRLDQDVGAIVANRISTQLGLSWDATDFLTVRMVAPIVTNWGTNVPDFDASGVWMGDIYGGATVTFLKTKGFKMGVDADIWFPSGTRNVYVGEGTLRAGGGLNMMGTLGPIDLMGNVGVIARPVIDTGADFDIGPELYAGQGLRITLPWLPLAFTQSLHYRGYFTNFGGGDAENALEVLGGVQMPFRNIGYNTHMTVDLQAGRGTNQGYGTTDFRMVAGVTFTRNPGKKPRPVVVEVEPPPAVLPPIVEEPVEEEWQEGEVARKVNDQIEIRDPIQFQVDTNIILPESLHILDAVAKVMNENALVKLVVIEGHASAEGDFKYNYELSASRAEAVYRQLLMNGVAPERLAWRGRGEVDPKVDGEDEESLAVNRRVEFHVAAQYTEFDDLPSYGKTQKLPWNGASNKVIQPLSPAEIEEARMKAERDRAAEEEEEMSSFGGSSEEEFSFDGDDASKSEEQAQPEPAPEAFEDTSFEESAEDEGDDFFFGEEEEPEATEPAPVEESADEAAPADDAAEDDAAEAGAESDNADASDSEGDE